MKSQMQSILFAVLVSACGSDRGVSVDPLSFMPQLPAVQQPAVVAPAPEPVKVAIVEPHVIPTKFSEAIAQGRDRREERYRRRARAVRGCREARQAGADPHIELAKMFITTQTRARDRGANKAVKLAPLSSARGIRWSRGARAVGLRGRERGVQEVRELDPDNVWAWNNLGFTELQLKKYDPAVEHSSQATSRPARPASCSTTSAPRSSTWTGSTKRARRSSPAASSARWRRRAASVSRV